MIDEILRKRSLPYVVQGDPHGAALETLIGDERARLRRMLTEHGAVLFRGFPVDGVRGLEIVVRALSGAPLEYSERSSPRTVIAGNIYTSTDYPAAEEIFLHNENSYQTVWPEVLYFCCITPSETLGATPLADIRLVHDAIDPAVRDEFERRGWMVVRNFRPKFGVAWQEVFNTGSPAEVDAYCAERAIETQWLDGDCLRTTAVRRAVHTHPATGAKVWFNHITFFHHTTLPADVREGLLALFGADGLPTDTYYGDGGRIPDDVVDHLRACYRGQSVRFDWQARDVLVVDNMRAAHGREPFSGSRRIAVAMAEPHACDLAVRRG